MFTTCPLCSGELKPKSLLNETDKTPSEKNTYAWICQDCPFVGFEYYTKKNTKALITYLEQPNP